MHRLSFRGGSPGDGHVRPLVAGKLLQVCREHFSLDRLVDYRTEAISDPLRVVNPAYRHLDGEVRSDTGKLTRRLAKFAAMTLEEPIEPKHVEPFVRRKAALQEEIETLQHQLDAVKTKRKETFLRAMTIPVYGIELSSQANYMTLIFVFMELFNIIHAVLSRNDIGGCEVSLQYKEPTTVSDIVPAAGLSHIHTLAGARQN